MSGLRPDMSAARTPSGFGNVRPRKIGSGGVFGGDLDHQTLRRSDAPAVAFSEEERGGLAERLAQSLDGDLDPNAESAWAAEIERRLARIDSGQATDPDGGSHRSDTSSVYRS